MKGARIAFLREVTNAAETRKVLVEMVQDTLRKLNRSIVATLEFGIALAYPSKGGRCEWPIRPSSADEEYFEVANFHH